MAWLPVVRLECSNTHTHVQQPRWSAGTLRTVMVDAAVGVLAREGMPFAANATQDAPRSCWACWSHTSGRSRLRPCTARRCCSSGCRQTCAPGRSRSRGLRAESATHTGRQGAGKMGLNGAQVGLWFKQPPMLGIRSPKSGSSATKSCCCCYGPFTTISQLSLLPM